MIEDDIEIPKFFKQDYDLILSVIDSPLQPFTYKTSCVSILRFDYYKEFWNSPIDKKMFTQSLNKIVNIFNEIFCLDDIYLCDVNLNIFKLQNDKQIFLDKVKLSFLDPEILAVVYFKRTNVIFVVNYDLSLVLFYEKRSKRFEKIINIFKLNGLDFIM